MIGDLRRSRMSRTRLGALPGHERTTPDLHAILVGVTEGASPGQERGRRRASHQHATEPMPAPRWPDAPCLRPLPHQCSAYGLAACLLEFSLR